MNAPAPATAKERLLQYAEGRFMRDGFAGVPVDEITGDLAMSKKTFYKIFRSKEDLVAALTARLIGDVRGRIQAVVRGPGTFIDKTRGIMAILPHVSRRIDSPMLRDLQRHLPRVWAEVERFRREGLDENFSALINQGIGEGFVRPDLNVRLFVLSYVAAIQAVIRPSVLSEESFSANEAMEGLTRIFFLGALTEESRTSLDIMKPSEH